MIAGVSKSISYEYNLDGSLKTLDFPAGDGHLHFRFRRADRFRCRRKRYAICKQRHVLC